MGSEMCIRDRPLTSPRTNLLPKTATFSSAAPSAAAVARDTKLQTILHKPAASQQKRNSTTKTNKPRPIPTAKPAAIPGGTEWLDTYKPLEPLTLNSRTPPVLYDIHFGFPFRVMQTDQVRLEPLVVSAVVKALSHRPQHLRAHEDCQAIGRCDNLTRDQGERARR